MERSIRVSPQALYDEVWRTVRANFYDRARLERWSHWEHRFDHDMHTDADAFHCIGQMLGSLGDEYTFLKTPQVVSDDRIALDSAPPPAFSRMLRGGIGYIRVNTFSHNNLVDEAETALRNIRHADGFILDLRGNGGGFLAQANLFVSLFLSSGAVMVNRTQESGGWIERVGYLYSDGYEETNYNEAGKEVGRNTWNRRRNLTGNKPLYVLIDGQTASASELVTGILRDNERARIFGRCSRGKGIAQDTFFVSNGCGVRMTNGLFYPPSMQWFGDDCQTVSNGVHPHVRVDHDPEYRGDLILDVAWEYMTRELDRLYQPRSNGSGWLVAGAIGLGLAVLAGTGRGGRMRVA